jgi:PPP family 3-phenylpropionic acid transporter
MGSFPAWTALSLAGVLLCTWRLPNVRETPAHAQAAPEPIGAALARPVVRWFFAALFFHVMAHFAIYGFLSLYLDARGYSKAMIGALWAVSVLVEIGWFYAQGRLLGRFSMERWLVLCGVATAVRMAMTGGLGSFLLALFVAQALHAFSFAAHHTACIAMVTKHFPGRLRGRGQALFTVTGYGFGGVLGVLAGGAVASRWGFEVMFGVATVLGVLGTACALRVQRLEGAPTAG